MDMPSNVAYYVIIHVMSRQFQSFLLMDMPSNAEVIDINITEMECFNPSY